MVGMLGMLVGNTHVQRFLLMIPDGPSSAQFSNTHKTILTELLHILPLTVHTVL